MISRFFLAYLCCSFLAIGAVKANYIESFRIEGNVRIETPTILSYVNSKPGEHINEEKIDSILKNLYATGLFSDVVIKKQEKTLVIIVVEHKIINRILFEGNERLKEDIILAELSIKPREVYTPGRAQEAAQKIRDIYRLTGRYGAKVEPKIIEKEEGRVDLVFEIDEGKATKIRRIIFVGNNKYSTSRLESVIMTKESRWYRLFTNDDTYDADRLSYDSEILRRYYNERGYADFRVSSVVAELDSDNQDFFITFTLYEGERYKYGKINLKNNFKKLDSKILEDNLTLESGDWFNSRSVEKNIETLVKILAEKGYPFVEITPKFIRNKEKKLVDVELEVNEGQHVYINRIDIIGNDRTDDDVVRREFLLAEGDAFNNTRLKRSEQKVKNLGFFKTVEVSKEETLAPDKIDLKVKVEDKPTGSLQFAGGYSTKEGVLGTVTMSERNLMGKALDFFTRAYISQKTLDFRGGLSDPYFLNKPLEAGFEVFHGAHEHDTLGREGYEKRKGGYRNKMTGGNTHFSYRIIDYLTQRWAYTIRRDHIDKVKANSSLYLKEQEGRWLLSAIDQQLFYDRRDSSIDPTDGYYIGVGNEFAGVGGDVHYLKNGLHLGNYFSLDDDHKWVFTTKVRTGIIHGLRNKPTRIVDRYILGADSLRGFKESGVGPRDAKTGDALGGKYYYKATAELFFPLGLPNEFGVRGSLFTDVGSVWGIDKKNYSKSGIIPVVKGDNAKPRIGIGVGLNWYSPLGLIGISVTKAVAHQKKIDKTKLFMVNFGTNF